MFDLANSDILLDKEVVMESESVLLVEVDVPSNLGSILPSHYICCRDEKNEIKAERVSMSRL
jgi:hypothetical protein